MELSNAEILGFVGCFNPYYKEDKYIYKRDIHIFDNLNLDDNSPEFIETFKHLEIMFKDNIIEFLNFMFSKSKNISNFGTILELIDIKKISNVDKYFALLKDKYENVIKRQIESLTDEELNRAVKILAKFVDLIYIHEKNCDFIENKIDQLYRKIKFLIYNELMRICKGDEYKEMKEFIYQKYINESENINYLIDLIDSLEKEDKRIFLEELTVL